MSDEPVRGAPSIDAFSVEKVENDVRHPPVSPHSLSFFRSLVSSRVPSSAWTAFCGGTRNSGGRFNLRACHSGRENLWFVSDFRGPRTVISLVRFICELRELTSVISEGERHLLQIWPRLIIRRKMCTASTRYWVTAKTKVRQSVFLFSSQEIRKLFARVNLELSRILYILYWLKKIFSTMELVFIC